MPAASDPVYQRLRTTRPHAIVALVDDEETPRRPLALGTGRAKWERALAAARGVDAYALELLDDGGSLIEIVQIRDRPEPLRSTPDSASEVDRVATLVSIALEAADRAVGRQSEHVSQVLEAALSVMKASADRTEKLERALAAVVKAHERALAAQQGEAGGGMSGDIMALLAAAVGGGMDLSQLRSLAAPRGNGAASEDDG